jgi:hypothetical protein
LKIKNEIVMKRIYIEGNIAARLPHETIIFFSLNGEEVLRE